MISINDLALVIQSLVCIVALAFIFLRFWADARLDLFRQEMFAIRDELFDYAAGDHIAFDDPAYRLLRQSMNGFIRYAHQLTFFRLCVTTIEVKLAGPPARDWYGHWESALKRVSDPTVCSALEAFHNRAMVCVAKRLIYGSPVLLAVAMCAIPVMAVHIGLQNLKNTKQVLNRVGMATLRRAVDTRMMENLAAATAAA